MANFYPKNLFLLGKWTKWTIYGVWQVFMHIFYLSELFLRIWFFGLFWACQVGKIENFVKDEKIATFRAQKGQKSKSKISPYSKERHAENLATNQNWTIWVIFPGGDSFSGKKSPSFKLWDFLCISRHHASRSRPHLGNYLELGEKWAHFGN